MNTLLQPHPVFRLPTEEEARVLGPEGLAKALDWRAEKIRAMEEDPLRCGYEPEIWALARREFSDNDEVLFSGGNRSGKSELAAKLAVEMMLEKPGAIVGCFHSSSTSSILQQQPYIHRYLPPEVRGLGKKGSVANVSYTLKNGFSEGRFILPTRSMCLFFNYMQEVDVLEGYEFDLVWFDELVPLPFLETIRFRIGPGRRLKVLVTFTPKRGYTPVVGNLLAGMEVAETARAHLLPEGRGLAPGCPPGHLPVVMRRPGLKRAAVWFHFGQNRFQPTEELKTKFADLSEEQVMIRAYGWAPKKDAGAFPYYGPPHRLTRARFGELAAAERGTRVLIVDPGDAKPWFMKWYWVGLSGVVVCYREWPDFKTHGEWAVPGPRVDWTSGPARRMPPRGLIGYKRVILEAEGWRWDEEAGQWDGTRAERVAERYFDPRGVRKAPGGEEGTDIQEIMELEQRDARGRLTGPAMIFEKAPGCYVDEGVQLMNDRMEYDEGRPVDVLNSPRWFIVDDLLQTDLAYREWTGAGTERCALKDVIDPDRYLVKLDPRHWEENDLAVRRRGYL